MSDANLISSVLALLIPIISVAVSLGALIVWIVMWNRRRMHEADFRHRERMAAIDKGLELPPDPMPQPEPMAPHSRYLLRGLIWLGVGLAITLGGHDWLRGQVAGVGWIAVAVGTAYLIFYFVEGRRPADAKGEQPAAGGGPAP